jgi:hypothetical protein
VTARRDEDPADVQAAIVNVAGVFNFCCRWVDPIHFWLTPTADCLLSAQWIALAGLFVDDSAVTADLYGLTAVTLVGCHELDPALAVMPVVPIRT